MIFKSLITNNLKNKTQSEKPYLMTKPVNITKPLSTIKNIVRSNGNKHIWQFSRVGGVNRVNLETGADPSLEELHAPFEQALRAGHLIPILFASSKTGAGIPQLLDALAVAA